MIFSHWLNNHRRSILFLLVILVLGGIISGLYLPVTLFPAIDFPRAVVTLDSGDQPTAQMLLQVTIPMEEALRRVQGVQNIRSVTSRGSSGAFIDFAWGTDMNTATLKINTALTQILPNLPPGTSINTRRLDPTVFPILAYSLVSAEQSLTQLRDIAFYQLRPLLFSINGISRINIMGGTQDEYQVFIDPERLQTYGLSVTDVIHALAAANTITVVGKLEDQYQLYLIISDTQLHGIEDISKTIIHTDKQGVIQLQDVADIKLGLIPQWMRVTANQQDAVLLEVFQQLDANSVKISDDVQHAINQYLPHLPSNIHLAKWYDQSELVVSSAHNVLLAILIGVILAALVVWVFLRNLSMTLISILVVPTSLAITILLLHVLNMSFNIMTLGGMAAAVGLIIDDAIVMIEHILRYVAKTGHHGEEYINKAAYEFFQPLAGSSAATVIIFAPLAFLSGVTGAFFKALSLTMGSALIISFLVTWLAIPILANYFLNKKENLVHKENFLVKKYQRHYARWLTKLIRNPKILIPYFLGLLIVTAVAYNYTETGFIPPMDEGGFIIDYKTAPGTSLSETDRLLRQVEVILSANPDVLTYSRRTGIGFGGADSFLEPNEGDFFVRLKPFPRHSVEQVMDTLRQSIQLQVPGLNIELAQLMEDIIGDLTAVPQPIEIKIYGSNTQELTQVAKNVADKISSIDGVVDVRDGIKPTGDSMLIHIDRTKAALEGMDVQTITDTLNTYLTGNISTQIQGQIKNIGVRVWLPVGLRQTSNDILNLMIRAPDGHLFPLKRVATIENVTGQVQITRENLKPMIAVTARISNRGLGSVIKDVEHTLATPDLLPNGVYYDLGGLYQQQQIAFHNMVLVFISAFVLVFILQLFLYENFAIVLAIMSLPLLSVSAVFIGLWLTHIELNISSMMGMTMIVGIVTEVAIFYFSEYKSLIRNNISHYKALILAGTNRLRPILMTTFAAILTLLPLAFALGQGSSMEQPLAVAIIAGLVAQLPLVLLVMPVFYNMLRRFIL